MLMTLAFFQCLFFFCMESEREDNGLGIQEGEGYIGKAQTIC